MTKRKLVKQINNFYAALATEEPIYHNCYVTKDDLSNKHHISEILYDLKENFFVHEGALSLYREVRRFIRKRHINIARVIKIIMLALSIGVIAWAGLSWVEIICKNLDPNPIYSPINFFIILTNL